MEIAEVADELYGLTPEEFTGRRNERAAGARKDGDAELAAQVRRLPRPTRSAWLVNLLARRCADELGELLDLGAQLRQAQEQLSGEELRRLGSNRHRVVYALAQRARELGAEEGHAATDATAREVQDTLEAALADPDAAAAVRSGRLAKPLRARGFEPVDLSGSVALPEAAPVPPDARKLRPVRDRGKERREREAAARREQELAAARRELAEAREAAEQAEQERDDARKQLQDRQSAADEAAARVADLERQLSQARRENAAAERALHAAEQEADDAERVLRDAQRRVRAAERAARG